MLRGPRSNLYIGQYRISGAFFTNNTCLGAYGALFVSGVLATGFAAVSLIKVRVISILLDVSSYDWL
jgi:hypothetical protein